MGVRRARVEDAPALADVIGLVSICPTRDDESDRDVVGEVSSIYVVPEGWGMGAGRRLMAAAVRSLTEAGFSYATLWVLDSNSRARRFYEAGSWRPDGATKRRDRHSGFFSRGLGSPATPTSLG
jgi:ribosomal protein S18 acetylase RimI-like enzyme